MKLLSVAVCDDEKNVLTMLSGAIERIFEQSGVRADIEMFSNVAALRARVREKHFDVAFLDIDMPGTDGIAFGKELRESGEKIDIIYVSGREDRVFDAFTAQPFGFIRKGNFLQDSSDIIPQLVSAHYRGSGEATVDIRTNTSIMSVRISELVYIESIKDYQYFYLVGKAEPLRVRSTMDKLEKQLERYGFIRIHKGYLVGYPSISRIDDEGVTLTDGRQLPISRRKLTEVRAKYLETSSRRGTDMLGGSRK